MSPPLYKLTYDTGVVHNSRQKESNLKDIDTK
jgi:hypothetical protein